MKDKISIIIVLVIMLALTGKGICEADALRARPLAEKENTDFQLKYWQMLPGETLPASMAAICVGQDHSFGVRMVDMNFPCFTGHFKRGIMPQGGVYGKKRSSAV